MHSSSSFPSEKSINLEEFQLENCRVCVDIKQWKEKARKSAFKQQTRKDAAAHEAVVPAGTALISTAMIPREVSDTDPCPVDSEKLGRATWTFLHTMAAYFPERPSQQDRQEITTFFDALSKFYPCNVCAEHLREELKTNRPEASSGWSLSLWLCQLHNKVNERLGKPAFNCSKVLERWRDGPNDGSCD